MPKKNIFYCHCHCHIEYVFSTCIPHFIRIDQQKIRTVNGDNHVHSTKGLSRIASSIL